MDDSETEQKRLDAQAGAIMEMIGGFPFLTPIAYMGKATKVVDVGCGTGIATVQLAELFPSAKVCGIDLSPVPESARSGAPANIAWTEGNVLDVDYFRPKGSETEVFAQGSLDYIFSRMLFLGIDDWHKYFGVVSAALAPGGFLEVQDLDWKYYRAGTWECVSDDWGWLKTVRWAVEKARLSTTSGSGAARRMEDYGLEVIFKRTFEFSYSPSSVTLSSQQMGRYVQNTLLPNFPELFRKLLGSQDIPIEEVTRLTNECLKDVNSEPGIHQKYTVTIARKV